jgi:NAD(P)-dependent dehydrogenase (short-subunit alcohol dehydrogenase family)
MATVLITGASRGIGLELTRQYAENGDTVFALCRNPHSADALNELARQSGGRVNVAAMDVSDEASIKAAAGILGAQPINILINNAGIRGGEDQSLEDVNTADWIEALKVMTIGPFRVVQAFLENLKRAKKPKIMTITSQMGASTWPMGGSYNYGSAKAAVNRVMMALAIDLKSQVIVNLIHPGWVQTDMGGRNADITPQVSAAGICKVIASVTEADSGKFLKWNGENHPW